jgi:SsrA-binding protein
MKPTGRTSIAQNRRARHDYDILDEVEAGISLLGSEVKSLREGRVQLVDGFARVDERDQMWLENVHISPYKFAVGFGAHDPERRRRLLMHRAEIDRLGDRVAQEHLSLVPLSMYFNEEGRVKVLLALARGRRKADKRQALAKADAQRDIQRELARRRKQG